MIRFVNGHFGKSNHFNVHVGTLFGVASFYARNPITTSGHNIHATSNYLVESAALSHQAFPESPEWVLFVSEHCADSRAYDSSCCWHGPNK